MNAIVTVVGEDKVGIIAAVCALLAENNVNILDLSQTILRGAFTMVMAVDVGGSSASIGELRTMLEDLGGKMGHKCLQIFLFCFVACCFVDVFGCRCVYTRLNKYAYSEFCYFSFMQRTDYVFVFRRVFVFDGRIRTSVP